MAENRPNIRVLSQVYLGEVPVSTDALDAAQKERLAVWLRVKYLNALFSGQVLFSPPAGFDLPRTRDVPSV